MVKTSVFSNNPEMKGIVALETNVAYAAPGGTELAMQILRPQWEPEEKGFPLVVFIQGSAWTTPDQSRQIPQLSLLARRGFVIASVTHRSCFDAPAPAFLQDVKAAIRYLRAHAADYRIDAERVCAWGTSSGGNTALLLGLTGDDPAYETDVWPGESTKVQAVVDCFGPTDLNQLTVDPRVVADDGLRQIMVALSGHPIDPLPEALPEENAARLREISPLCRVKPGVEYPPFMLLQGDADELVPYDQSARMAEALDRCGAQVELVRVSGAPHEGSFWSIGLLEHIIAFIQRAIG